MLVRVKNGKGMLAGKVYLIDQGRRRWLRDINILSTLGNKPGYRWPEDIQEITEQEALNYPYGAPTPIILDPKMKKMNRDMNFMRQFITQGLTGKGVEFGAAANPLPIPLGTKILYADLFNKEQLESELYSTSLFEYVPTDIHTNFDKMEGIKNSSLDFIIASHVIEHVRDPIGAMNTAWDKLKKGGELVLIVPKRERTLDKTRPATQLEHLVEDNKSPSRYRDALHVVEFYAHTNKIKDLKKVYDLAIKSITDDQHSMHYHVWNEHEFNKVIKYINSTKKKWKYILKEKALPGKENYEFYIKLRKVGE
ncbi:MAG: methyltransferase domain-containing protein [Candidatus Nomurabacteria bacterium]|nr:MAG: methyltransferase domain-containing protein [Candidatus Nomurabacteria bacterium]HRV76009.1 methyltransferase domain-containing protein [Candidatus Saccharimonadales bacterium]